MAERNPNWGGRRPNAGRPKRFIYKKIPVLGQIERSEREPLTPTSDLTVCIAEMDEEGKRGIYVGDIWYGADEALAIAAFVERSRHWLSG